MLISKAETCGIFSCSFNFLPSNYLATPSKIFAMLLSKGVYNLKALVLHPTFELYERKEKAFCSSLQVAEAFEKRHDNVLADIRNLDFPEEFRLLNFQESYYTNEQNKRQPMFLMTRDGFIFLTMGYRGKKAAAIKVAYIKRFNDMERYIRDYILARDDFEPFTRAIQDAHDEPQSHHYTNECNMINRIVLGMDAKKFKELHGLGNVSSIRPYLNTQQANAIKKLQCEDIPLLYKGVEYQERKTILTNFYQNRLCLS